ncbi:MAG TPA: hypothetical protein VJO52_03740, partial [Gemmatimonadaceae bacterium]|nr:hypothetical protein [Gemmatimonadaceae bacterium]
MEGFLALVERITTRKLKETQGSLGCAELRAAARGEMSVSCFEQQNARMVTTDARATLGAIDSIRQCSPLSAFHVVVTRLPPLLTHAERSRRVS